MFDKIQLVYTGTSNQRERFTLAHGSMKRVAYPATVFVLHHQIFGMILIDTGYSVGMKRESGKFVYMMYRQMIGSKVDTDVLLDKVRPKDIALIVLSHFHPDHIGGCSLFPKTPYISSRAIESLANRSTWSQLRKGYFAKLFSAVQVDSYIEDKPLIPLINSVVGMEYGYDILGDGSLIAFATPGHAQGHYSFIIKTLDGPICYAVDASWHIESMNDARHPSRIVSLFVDDYAAMIQSIDMLKDLSTAEPEIPIVFCHCVKSHEKLQAFFEKGRRTEYECFKNNYIP
ncbi:MBL fold metallo-hydrolase [Listeria booriae]|uniref:MBL fold metallo-hydrolase n=1 Tax=Listeria booriae TaxID=1552123 RepID=UPI0016253E84|nr:MBL fold metallo-hydrolase [Listeria booriae]MBC2259729.1 MBL fold metallo-hydrolase [Listeria booriae]